MNLAEKIKELHASKYKFVIVSSGGGSNAIASLLKVPGASNTVLEAYIPYAKESLDFYLMKKPDFYASKDTSLRMAARAYSAAKKIDQESSLNHLLGVSITASLSTTYEKRGDHKFHIALQTRDFSKSISCKLEKGTRTREEEEELVTAFVVNLLAECSELEYDYPKIPEEVVFDEVKAEKGWAELMSNKINYVLSEDVSPELIFPGAFYPYHDGHKAMKDLAEQETGKKIFFEICIQNVDKPPISYHQIKKTVMQFNDSENWVLTKAGKFSEKSKLFPNSTFIIGADTLVRIMDERFYESRKEMLKELEIFNENNNHFLVFGREYQGKFTTLSDVQLPDNISARFKGFDEEIFRKDISSTSIRLSNCLLYTSPSPRDLSTSRMPSSA